LTTYTFPVFKFVIAIIWDALDFTLFRIPGIGTLADIISIPLALVLWGPAGVIAAWELFDATDQLDAEVPTMTIIGIISVIGGARK
jgi:hypothetical protein